MAIPPIQNRMIDFHVEASAETSDHERRREREEKAKQASKNFALKDVSKNSEAATDPKPQDPVVDSQIVDSEKVIELLNHKPNAPQDALKKKFLNLSKNAPLSEKSVNKKL